MSDLVPDPFEYDGEEFPVVRMPNGDLGIPLRRLCVPLSLDPDAQRKLVERSAWSKGRTAKMYVRLPGDDRSRQHFVISYRIVPMWVANITTSQVKDEEGRKRTERWQVEFADALYDYVFNGGAINPRALAAAAPVIALPAPERYEPVTFPLEDVVVLIRQRFGVRISEKDLRDKLRQGGVFRRNGKPTVHYDFMFWHTGTAYELYGHQIDALYKLYESIKLRLEAAAQRSLPLDPPGWPELPLEGA